MYNLIYNNMKINDLLGYVWDRGGWGERGGWLECTDF